MSPYTAQADPRRWRALGVLCLSLLVIGLDNTILNVAIPTLERDLGASASELQWIVDAYMLVFAGLLLTAGSLGDRFGRKRALSAGLLVFAAGSALASSAESAEALIASRGVMGLGGALTCRARSPSWPRRFSRASGRGRSPSGPLARASASRSARPPAGG